MKYIRKKYREFPRPTRPSAKTILEDKMHVYHKEANLILRTLIKSIEDDPVGSQAQLKSLYTLMDKANQTVIDCAHKLAPYQSPKLESVEIKGEVDHRYVIRTPQPMATIDQWMKHTGAQQSKLENTTKVVVKESKIEPSIHDFEDDEEEDYIEPGMLN